MSDIVVGRKEEKTETNNLKNLTPTPLLKEVFDLVGKTPVRTSVWRLNKLSVCFQQQK